MLFAIHRSSRLYSTLSSGYSLLASSRIPSNCVESLSTEPGLGSPTCLSNNLRAVADNGERVWCIPLYFRAIFVATAMGEVSELEIFLRFDGVLALAWPSRSSIFFAPLLGRFRIVQYRSVYVRGLIFTCKCGSVIFSNMLDFAVYV